MVQVSFVPSQVTMFFPNSAFQKGEKEALAAWIISFLREQKDDQWTEFTWKDFAQHLRSSYPVDMHPAYVEMAKGQARQMKVALCQMIQDSHIEYEPRDDEEWLKPGDKLMEFYSTYVN